mmetsp:Transcript_55264/g.89371  ORF Transcript_55264/g.89371 Transcript_55264/m.89371 type:complete len:246 (+) Transcript_55264:529-1266(+)
MPWPRCCGGAWWRPQPWPSGWRRASRRTTCGHGRSGLPRLPAPARTSWPRLRCPPPHSSQGRAPGVGSSCPQGRPRTWALCSPPHSHRDCPSSAGRALWAPRSLQAFAQATSPWPPEASPKSRPGCTRSSRDRPPCLDQSCRRRPSHRLIPLRCSTHRRSHPLPWRRPGEPPNRSCQVPPPRRSPNLCPRCLPAQSRRCRGTSAGSPGEDPSMAMPERPPQHDPQPAFGQQSASRFLASSQQSAW